MWILRITQAALFGGGGVLLLLALRNVQRGFVCRWWPQTQGRIARAFVLVQTAADGGKTYGTQLEYEYTIEGTTYRGKRRRFGDAGSWSQAQAKRMLAPYSPGASVRVFFNPRKPEDAVLIPGASWGNLAIAFGGMGFIACGYLLHRHTK